MLELDTPTSRMTTKSIVLSCPIGSELLEHANKELVLIDKHAGDEWRRQVLVFITCC